MGHIYLYHSHPSNSSITFKIFISDNMYCDLSITTAWNYNIFINDFPLPCRRVKNQSCQVIRVRSAQIPSVFQLSAPYPTVNLNPFSHNGNSQHQNLTNLEQVVYKNAAAVAFHSV